MKRMTVNPMLYPPCEIIQDQEDQHVEDNNPQATFYAPHSTHFQSHYRTIRVPGPLHRTIAQKNTLHTF